MQEIASRCIIVGILVLPWQQHMLLSSLEAKVSYSNLSFTEEKSGPVLLKGVGGGGGLEDQGKEGGRAHVRVCVCVCELGEESD